MRFTKPEQFLLAGLAGALKGARGIPSKDVALSELRWATGQDFGDDVKAWRVYLRAHPLPPDYIGRRAMQQADEARALHSTTGATREER